MRICVGHRSQNVVSQTPGNADRVVVG